MIFHVRKLNAHFIDQTHRLYVVFLQRDSYVTAFEEDEKPSCIQHFVY